VPVLPNQRLEALAQAFVSDPHKIGWRAYQSVYPKSSQHAAETGFSRMLKKVEFSGRVAELQAEAAADAKITLESLLREAAEIQSAAMTAKQYSAANSALKLKAELSGHYVQRKEDVFTPRRSEAEIIARLRQLLGSGEDGPGEDAGSIRSVGRAEKLRNQAQLN
jgi:hypothetical protein